MIPDRIVAQVSSAPWFGARWSPYVLLDADLRIRAANPAFARATGTHLDDLRDQLAADVFPAHPTDPDAQSVAVLTAAIEGVLRTGRPSWLGLHRHHLPHPLEDRAYVHMVWLPVGRRHVLHVVEHPHHPVSSGPGGRGAVSTRVHVLHARLRAVESAALSRPPPPPALALGDLARHHAETTRYALDHPAALRRLRAATGAISPLGTLDQLLPALLEQAMALIGADLGDVQVLDPAVDGLRLVAHAGFDDTFADVFGLVDDDGTASGRALRRACQVSLPDVERDEGFAPYRTTAARYGIRSVQSTPLLDYAGRVMGVVSTHWREPHQPDPVDLRLLEMYADHAGERITTLLRGRAGASGEHWEAWQVATAMLDAVLAPSPDMPSVPSGARPPPVPRARAGPFIRALRSDGRFGGLADLVVREVFATSLELDSARAMATDPAVRERLARATDSLDRLLTDVRSTVLAVDDEGSVDPAPR